ncbi:MAG: hypothetical protein HOP02_16990 [Methylococcaceae bacterium]|nr:hypothetical protein [Methylococcaceae bacterium]
MKFGIDKLKVLAYRIYSDFIRPSRLNEWHLFLQTVLDNGYEIHSVASFWDVLNSNQLSEKKKYFILRHDIDTDTSTARKMWEIEKQLQVTSSHYFRLSTIDISLMQEIDNYGGEASYHFEELATYAKTIGITDKEEVLGHLDIIRAMFKKNLEALREQTGIPMRTVASHGDWMNRQLGVTNCVILDDKNFRKELRLELEVYDPEFMNAVTSRHADAPYPVFWNPNNPLNAIQNQEKVIYLLVHPRQWRANILVNLIDNLYRVWEGVIFFFKTYWKN